MRAACMNSVPIPDWVFGDSRRLNLLLSYRAKQVQWYTPMNSHGWRLVVDGRQEAEAPTQCEAIDSVIGQQPAHTRVHPMTCGWEGEIERLDLPCPRCSHVGVLAPVVSVPTHKSVQQLIEEQGVKPIKDTNQLIGIWPEELDVPRKGNA